MRTQPRDLSPDGSTTAKHGAPAALATTLLRSPRLVVRFLRPGDEALMAEACAANRAWLAPWEPAREDVYYTPAHQAAQIEENRRAMMNDSAYRFIAFEAAADESLASFCGMAGLSGVARGPFQSCFLGYWVAAAKAGSGLGRELVTTVVRWAFERAALHRVQAAIQTDNRASRRLIKAIGFRHEGRAERYLNIAGAWRDHDLYAMTAEEIDGLGSPAREAERVRGA